MEYGVIDCTVGYTYFLHFDNKHSRVTAKTILYGAFMEVEREEKIDVYRALDSIWSLKSINKENLEKKKNKKKKSSKKNKKKSSG